MARHTSRDRHVHVQRYRPRRCRKNGHGTFSLTVTNPPGPASNGCRTVGRLKEPLSGPVFNGQTPIGTATADESHLSTCGGGYTILTAQVSRVNLPNGSQLLVTLDFNPVGTITLSNGSGTMTPYNLGSFSVSMDAVRVYSSLSDGNGQQILIGGTFR